MSWFEKIMPSRIKTERRTRSVPEGLWHALMFYTTGELVRRDFAQYGLTYIPYADKNDLWAGAWTNYRGPLTLFWRQHLDGKLTVQDAIDKIIGALAIDSTTSKHN